MTKTWWGKCTVSIQANAARHRNGWLAGVVGRCTYWGHIVLHHYHRGLMNLKWTKCFRSEGLLGEGIWMLGHFKKTNHLPEVLTTTVRVSCGTDWSLVVCQVPDHTQLDQHHSATHTSGSLSLPNPHVRWTWGSLDLYLFFFSMWFCRVNLPFFTFYYHLSL